MVSFGRYYQNICPLSTWLYHFTQEVESISPALEIGFGHFFGQRDISKYDTSRGLRSTCTLRFAHYCCSLKSWAQVWKSLSYAMRDLMEQQWSRDAPSQLKYPKPARFHLQDMWMKPFYPCNHGQASCGQQPLGRPCIMIPTSWYLHLCIILFRWVCTRLMTWF